MEGRTRTLFAGAALVLAGCAGPPDVPFPDWTAAGPATPPESSSAYGRLAAAAEDAERLAGDDLRRVFFTPRDRVELIERLAGPRRAAVQAAVSGVRMPPRVAYPFEALPHQAGWRLLGRTLAWEVERAVLAETYDLAVQRTLDATWLGLALTGGSASDAALGYSILDEARRALAPAIVRLGQAELRRLGTGIEAALQARPEAGLVAQNERLSMLRAVQFVQDAYREKQLGKVSEELGREVEPAVSWLEGLRAKGPERRAEYFAGFAAEAEAWSAYYEMCLSRNAAQRARTPQPKLAESRPWRRFARHFFRTLDPLLEMRDESLCRTRILGLGALLRAEAKVNGSAPFSLIGISKELTTDPYTGGSLAYRPEKDRFLLYSFGADLTDDAGETNEAGTEPDLRLEGEL
jgi:hypothetical protein